MSAAAMHDLPTAPDQLGAGIAAPERPVAVFVPGLGLDARSSEAVRHLLGGQSTVVLLPSMGHRAARRSDLRVERQAQRLLDAMPPGKRSILVGHSASCPVVVEAAARCSDVVGLVLVGPVTDPRAQSWPRMLGQWLRVARHERPRESRVLLPQYGRTGALSMLRGMNAVRRFRTDERLRLLRLPVEIIRGEQDRIAPADWCSRLRSVSAGRLTTVPGAAHMVPLTHPLAVVAGIQRVRVLAGP
jgi:pimeloyl-ACP methyl ester carboxylesterase